MYTLSLKLINLYLKYLKFYRFKSEPRNKASHFLPHALTPHSFTFLLFTVVEPIGITT
jgi:hypothetical protein